MALDPIALNAAIYNALEAATPVSIGALNSNSLSTLYAMLAAAVSVAVVEHLTANAEITPNGSPPMKTESLLNLTGKGKLT